jgi:hypothetical protein
MRTVPRISYRGPLSTSCRICWLSAFLTVEPLKGQYVSKGSSMLGIRCNPYKACKVARLDLRTPIRCGDGEYVEGVTVMHEFLASADRPLISLLALG